MFGARRPSGGQILMGGSPLRLRDPADAVARGIALVTEDRKRTGFVPAFPLWQSITLPWLRMFSHLGVLQLRSERIAAAEAAHRFDIRARSIDATMRELSGGNQQKAILARWLSQPIRVLLLDEPTKGVDVGAKADIYRFIRQYAASGVPIVLISSELSELEGLCDRVLLLAEGRVIGELHGDEINEPRMLAALFGEGGREGEPS
jgi:ABC-type sugar transport system ATPase subunit